MERISVLESSAARQARERIIEALDPQTEGLCKTIDEVKRIINEQLLKDSGLSLQEQYDLWRKVELLALEGEKDLTEEERIPFETLQKNYEKYFLKRIKDIKEFTRL